MREERQEELKRRETDRRYVKFKMQRIKELKQKGNNPAAERHATELIQYLGLDDESELPIEPLLE